MTHPIMKELVWLEHSPSVVIQQFFSAGLLGEPPVWSNIVFKMAGVTTFAELARDAPVEAHTYRKQKVSTQLRRRWRFGRLIGFANLLGTWRWSPTRDALWKPGEKHPDASTKAARSASTEVSVFKSARTSRRPSW